ncbi:conserved hypothetical protein [uncultured Pleomorphomonas sp.]|uniref:Uncharacterized protein n=1 Tax=uncultured Pleomorphomonas sp. TaxID=442121 RepID=A0A212LR18_9HYPH|nr:hypothetical protein [uncultured Pleomorphomonas sp.]SCM79921.1 conserved hypothetical protein [uncultured Pleomorphomonas sp.]
MGDEKRYQIAVGDEIYRDVVRAPDREPGDFLTRSEAAQRIVDEMNGVIEIARITRRRAMRILRAETKKNSIA